MRFIVSSGPFDRRVFTGAGHTQMRCESLGHKRGDGGVATAGGSSSIRIVSL